MTSRLILIRHGVTRWNEAKRYCGRRDIPLSRAGRAAVRRLRQELESLRCDRVYSSDRKRAFETARILFNDTKITRVKGLREMDFGMMEGLTHAQIMKRYPGTYEKWLRDPFKNTMPGAEVLSSFEKRVRVALRRIVRANRGKTVAVVCHGGVIGIFVTTLLKTKDFWPHIPGAASLTLVAYKKGGPRLTLFNATKHAGPLSWER